MHSISLTVKGKVQGVFFRKHTVDAALRIGVCGFVRNMPDGSVYIEATGSREQLGELERWCHTGSPRSKVEQVEIGQLPLRTFKGFVVSYL